MQYPSSRWWDILKTVMENLATAAEATGAIGSPLAAISTKLATAGDVGVQLVALVTQVTGVKAALAAGGGTEAALQAIATAVRANGGVELLYSNSAESAATVSSVDEQFFDKTYNLAAGACKAGDEVDIDLSVLVHGTMAGAGNLTLKLYVGTQVVWAPAAYAAAQNDIITCRARVRLRAADAAVAEIMGTKGAPGTAVPTRSQTTGLTLVPGTAQLIRASAQFANANAGNVCKLTDLAVRAAHV